MVEKWQKVRREIHAVVDMRNRIGFFYDKFMLVCIVSSIIPLFFKGTNPFFFFLEKFTVCVFITDYLLRWLTADIELEKWGRWAFLLYPVTPFAMVDLLSILPSLTTLNSGLQLFRLLRLNKGFKALRLLRRSKSFMLMLAVIRREKRALSAVTALAAGYILLSALVMFQVEPATFDNFFYAIYWAVVTLTTVGYGDLYPVSDVGRVISMISSIMGIAIVALPTGIITAGYMSEINRDRGEETAGDGTTEKKNIED